MILADGLQLQSIPLAWRKKKSSSRERVRRQYTQRTLS